MKGQVEPAELIVPIRVCPGDIDHQLRRKARQRFAQAVSQPLQVLPVAGAAIQVNVQIGGRLFVRVVVKLVNRQGEYRGILGEDRGRAIAVVYVAIHHHRTANGSVALQHADGYGHVVDGAETFPMPRERVVKSAAHVVAHPLFQGQPRGQGSTRGSQEKASTM